MIKVLVASGVALWLMIIWTTLTLGNCALMWMLIACIWPQGALEEMGYEV